MSKKAEVICLDVGIKMHKGVVSDPSNPTHLQNGIRALADLLKTKLCNDKKTDKTGVVLFGCDETRNDLAEDGQYQNVKVVSDLGPVTLELLSEIENNTTAGSKPSDILDAVVVAVQMIEQTVKKLKFSKKILLITNGECPTADVDQLDTIIDVLKQNEIELRVFGLDLDDDDSDSDDDDDDKPEKTPLDPEGSAYLLKRLSDESNGAMFSFSDGLSILRTVRKPDVRQTSTFRGTLDLGTKLSIPVHAYTRTLERKVPSMKMVSLSLSLSLSTEH